MFIKKIKELHYKELFLYGAYISIMVLAFFASIIDLYIGNRVDVYVDILFGTVAFLAYRYIFLRERLEYAAIALFWIATGIELLFLIIHDVDLNIILAILIPIIAFISLLKQKIIIHLSLYYTVLILFLVYYAQKDPLNPFLHNSAYLLTYVMAHLFIVAFGIFYFLAIDESVKRLEMANQTQALLLNEVHHRVKNNLNLISSIWGLQAERIDDPMQKEFLELNQKRIGSMGVLHEILYTHGLVDHADLKIYIDQLVEHIICCSMDERVEVDIDIEHRILPMDSMIQIGIMLNEMMTNTLKHAPRADAPIQITVHTGKCEGGYCLDYCDNAKEVDVKMLEKGFGYSLIMLSARYFKAVVEYDMSEGFCYKVIFPSLEEVYDA